MWWKIDDGAASLLPLPKNHSWFLLNPRLYYRLPSFLRSDWFIQVAPGKYFGPSSVLVFATEDPQTMAAYETAAESGSLEEIARELLLRLLHLTGQATLPRPESLIALQFAEIAELPKHVPPADVSPSRVQEFTWRTAITTEHIQVAATSLEDFEPPTHESLFLDASEAHRGSDYKKAILYSAMAAEIAFGSVIDTEYDRLIAAQTDDRLRIIRLSRPAGQEVYKDPIYEKLRPRADFRLLINEVTLYVLRRSLLCENEDLYQRALRLYSTRNELAHSGVLKEDNPDKTYSLDLQGSLKSLKTTLDLFSWLRLRADFALPEVSFARVDKLE
jgi:hypothetical protein